MSWHALPAAVCKSTSPKIMPATKNAVSETKSSRVPSPLEPFIGEDPLPMWAVSYYEGFQRLLAEGSTLLSKEPAVPAGLIASTGVDCTKVFASLCSLEEYQKQVLSLYLNENREDALTMYADLYLRLDSNSEDAVFVYDAIKRILAMLQDSPLTDKTLLEKRLSELSAILKTAPGQKTAENADIQADDSSRIPCRPY